MKDIVPILSVFLSGVFGLSVALLTWKLSLQREKTKYQQDILAEDYKKIEVFYTGCLASVYKVIHITKANLDDSNRYIEFSLMSAQASILADELFQRKLNDVCRTLSDWSHNYKLGSPKKFGDTGLVQVTSSDQAYLSKAETLYLELMKEMREFTQIIKDQLKALKLAQSGNG